MIFPSDKNNQFCLQSGEEKEFVITGLDQYNNPIETEELIWKIENASEACLQNVKNENSRIVTIPENFKGEFKLIIYTVGKDINVTINIEVPAILQQLVKLFVI